MQRKILIAALLVAAVTAPALAQNARPPASDVGALRSEIAALKAEMAALKAAHAGHTHRYNPERSGNPSAGDIGARQTSPPSH